MTCQQFWKNTLSISNFGSGFVDTLDQPSFFGLRICQPWMTLALIYLSRVFVGSSAYKNWLCSPEVQKSHAEINFRWIPESFPNYNTLGSRRLKADLTPTHYRCRQAAKFV